MLANNSSEPVNIVYLWRGVETKVAWNYCKYAGAMMIIKSLKIIIV